MPNQYSQSWDRAQDSDLATFLGDQSQSENLYEIKLPLIHTQNRLVNMLENPIFS